MRLGLRRFAGAANGDATTLDGMDSSDFATSDHTHPPSGVTDHGALTGLADDDHTQYLLATGARTGATAGAQTFERSNADTSSPSDVVIIKNTSSATTDTNFGAGILFNHKQGASQRDVARIVTRVDSSLTGTHPSIVFQVGYNGNDVADAIEITRAQESGTPPILKFLDATARIEGIATFNASTSFILGTTSYAIEKVGGSTVRISGFSGVQLYSGTVSAIVANFNAASAVNYLLHKTFIGGTTAATAAADLAASTTTQASLRLRNGTWPTTPNDGEIANDGNAINIMVNGTNAVNTDGGIRIYMQSSTDDRPVGGLLWQYTTKTDASRATQGSLTAWYTTTERKCITWGANSTVPLVGFYGVTPVARPAAYTQTYSTATRTVNAYTTDDESAAYTGIDNAQAGTVYAQLTDLNALRTAYENLRASYDNLLQVVNSLIDDGQAVGLLQ